MDECRQRNSGQVLRRQDVGARGQLAIVRLLIGCMLFWSLPPQTDAYSFLTHEDLVDVTWKASIRPAILARFPNATDAQLHAARAYAYGGTTIQDMGYYPFGHQFFSNLTHYVRSGEFVNNLLRDSRTVNEYAFALGALSHYVGDNVGHRYATNISTPIEFPSLEKKYGPVVTYDQAPHPHVRTEFAYDVEQLSLHRFAPAGYLHSVGFRVPRKLVERAFFETYGLRLRTVLGHPVPAVHSYQSSVERLLPKFAHAEVLIHHKDFPPEEDTPAFHVYLLRQAQAETENDWGRFSRKPGFQVRLISILIRIVPKIGPISNLAIRGPSAETNRWYIESMNRATDHYEQLLRALAEHPSQAADLPDRDLDTGNLVRPGGYALTDSTYAELLHRLTAQPQLRVPAGLQQNILAYYADPDAPIATKKNHKAWKRLQTELTTLRGMQTLNGKKFATLEPPIARPGTTEGKTIDDALGNTEE